VAVGPGVAKTHQPADGGGGGVQDADAIVLDHAPPAVGVRVVGRALIHKAGGAVEQRAVHDIAVPGDPAGVGGAPVAVFISDVEDIFQRGVGMHHITAVGMQNALGAPGGAGCVQDEQRVFRIHHFGGAGGGGDG